MQKQNRKYGKKCSGNILISLNSNNSPLLNIYERLIHTFLITNMYLSFANVVKHLNTLS